jgi:ubiquinone/menaquinone biosynthesis C-methylase UbiE
MLMSRGKDENDLVVEKPGEYWRLPDIAQSYDRVRFGCLKGRLYRWREERAVERALSGLERGSSILDAACGTGRITALLARNGFQAAGCDISPAMMAVAHQRLRSLGHEVPFVEASVERLPYQDNDFDGVSCIGLLMHLDEETRARALSELARVSRGPLVLQYGCLDGLRRPDVVLCGRQAGQVRFPISVAEMRRDFTRGRLTERAMFWILRGWSSSVVVLVSKA